MKKLLINSFFLFFLFFFFKQPIYCQDLKKDTPFLFTKDNSETQNDPVQIRIVIFTLSHLYFGSFYPGSNGGTIYVNPNGNRTANGSVVLLNIGLLPSPASFEIKAPPYTSIHLMIDEQIILKNQNGNTLICIPEISDNNSSMVTPHNAESGFSITIGAKLIVDGFNYSQTGDYSGKMNVFIVIE
jgi:hypothetical protein